MKIEYIDTKAETHLEAYADTVVRDILKPLQVISVHEKFAAWLLSMTEGENIIISVVNDGLKSGVISIPGSAGKDFPAVLLHPESSADISCFGTEYKSFPLPCLVFGFRLTPEGRVSSCRLGVVENTEKLKSETKMYHYPLSNVNGFHICAGNNPFPKCEHLHTLGSLPYYIMSMPN